MPTSARILLNFTQFFGLFADVGIRAPEPFGLLQQPLTSCEVCGHAPVFREGARTGRHFK